MPELSCFDSIQSKIRQKSAHESVYLHECMLGEKYYICIQGVS